MPDGTKPPTRLPGSTQLTTLHLRILATTDLHMHLGAETATGGLARLAPLIAAERASCANVLLFDNGDLIEGTPLADELARAGLGPHDIHPAIAALNGLGYDAANLGNHDFANGVEFLRRVLRDAAYPLTLANAGLTRGARLWSESLLLTRRMQDETGQDHDLNVGVFGVLPPQTVDWEAELARDLQTEDVVVAACRAVSSLRARGADVIIALSHGGYGSGPVPRAENAAGAIAEIEGVNAVIAGHTHEILVHPASAATAPIVKAGFAGSHLAAISLRLQGAPGAWRITCSRAEALPAAKAPCPSLADTMTAVPAEVAARLSRPVGHSALPLRSHFSLLGRDAGLRLVESALRAHIDSALPSNDLPVLTAFAPFRTGGRGGPGNFVSIAAGPLRRGDLSNLYPFTNHVAAIQITGAEIADWLERAATIFAQLPDDGEIHPLIAPSIPGFQFDIVAGLDYRINLSRPAAYDSAGRPQADRGRVEALRHQGRSLRADDRFLLVTNSYRMSGGPLYAPLTAGKTCLLPEKARIRVRDLIARHLGNADAPPPGDAAFFGLSARAGSRASFDTAAAAIAADCPLPAESLGLTETGFQRLVLNF
ncbi:5'-nucleotidase C-terminal domain-containing protein [Paracoccus xiamenensis]|uniref:5'-nucleotidase C-terminal domain-containing protein n=1 Tax=Paracoccus xiamenensis TaxID=2714901 RepID=UPI00140A3C86|nr:5'-nucleotidase C-terminal domain-containing protein [Paracoccus xiamenensis]NHF72622.1 bifunctional 2',3'-cyclic-nucleotide 2'-phosphodiesterase/3'-nucleotidase [Paracoccus xiamenensis]